MPVQYSTKRCRGARLPWKDCERTVSAKLPVDDIKENHTGVSVRCAACGTTNFIREGEPSMVNGQREAIQE